MEKYLDENDSIQVKTVTISMNWQNKMPKLLYCMHHYAVVNLPEICYLGDGIS
jgi:hypothetical protein